MLSKMKPWGIAVLLVLAPAACAAETVIPETGDANEHDAEPTDNTSEATSDSSTSSGGGAQCGPGSVDQADECEVCVLQECANEAYECCMHEGCLDIIDCARDTSCDGFECYTPEKCQSVIDAAGGPNIALNFAQPLGDCALAKCSESCE